MTFYLAGMAGKTEFSGHFFIRSFHFSPLNENELFDFLILRIFFSTVLWYSM